jgi:hypothetical protein
VPTEYTEETESRRAGAGEVARELREGTRMGKRGIGRLARGTHGIHGKGGGIRRRCPRITRRGAKGGKRAREGGAVNVIGESGSDRE